MYNMLVSLSTRDNREVEVTSVRKLKGEKRKTRKKKTSRETDSVPKQVRYNFY